jgi:hypothetical protein
MSPFVWGCIGGVAPEVVRWREIAQRRTPSEWRRVSYWVATIAYVPVAGVFASLVAEPTPYAAFVAGVTAQFGIKGALDATDSKGNGNPQIPEELSVQPLSLPRLAHLILLRHASFLGLSRRR